MAVDSLTVVRTQFGAEVFSQSCACCMYIMLWWVSNVLALTTAQDEYKYFDIHFL